MKKHIVHGKLGRVEVVMEARNKYNRFWLVRSLKRRKIEQEPINREFVRYVPAKEFILKRGRRIPNNEFHHYIIWSGTASPLLGGVIECLTPKGNDKKFPASFFVRLVANSGDIEFINNSITVKCVLH